MAQQHALIKSYTNDDVDIVLQKTFDNVQKDREKTQVFIDNVKKQIEEDPMNSIFLLDKAIALLDVQSKQNDVLVKLAGVMQRLQANVIAQYKQANEKKGNFAELMQEADLLKIESAPEKKV